MRSPKRLLCAILALVIAVFGVIASAEDMSAETAFAETVSADGALAGMEVTASDSADAESNAVTDEVTASGDETTQEPSPLGGPSARESVQWTDSSEDGSADPRDGAERSEADEVVPPDEPTTDAPAEEETTSSVSPDGEPASPEGEASDSADDLQKPSPSGEGGSAEALTDEVVPPAEPTTDAPAEEETTSSVSPDGETASPEREASENPAATQKPSPDGEGAERSEAEEVSPTAEPTEAPTVEPTVEPTAAPTVEPTAEPTTAPTMEPTAAPATDPTAAPTVKPTTAPAESPEITLTVMASKDIDVQEDTYTIPAGSTGRIKFSWRYSGDHSGYKVTVTDAQKAVVYEGEQEKSSYKLSVEGLSEGRYTFKVTALSEGKAVATEKYRFRVIIARDEPDNQPPGEPPEGEFPGGGRPSGFSFGGFSGVRPSGGKSSSAAPGAEADQGFTVTPGKALTSAHSTGTRDMTLYGALTPEPAEGAMTRLTLGETALEVALDGGESAFTAQLEGDRLILAPEGDGEVWTLNGYALRALNRSGIAAVELALGADTAAFPTDYMPRGDVYAELCAAGYVSSDYDYSVSASGVSVCVDGRTYRLDASGQLLLTEE